MRSCFNWLPVGYLVVGVRTVRMISRLTEIHHVLTVSLLSLAHTIRLPNSPSGTLVQSWRYFSTGSSILGRRIKGVSCLRHRAHTSYYPAPAARPVCPWSSQERWPVRLDPLQGLPYDGAAGRSAAVRAPGLGPGGRRFKSARPDQQSIEEG